MQDCEKTEKPPQAPALKEIAMNEHPDANDCDDDMAATTIVTKSQSADIMRGLSERKFA